jgi:hypothetical protein
MKNYRRFLFKGVECRFSKDAEKVVPLDEDKVFLLKTFLLDQPINSIEWVDEKKIFEPLDKQLNEFFPIYSIGNGVDTLIFWPILMGSDLCLVIKSLEEVPDYKDLIK